MASLDFKTKIQKKKGICSEKDYLFRKFHAGYDDLVLESLRLLQLS